MYGYIYITTCKVNGKKYVGQKKSPEFLGDRYLGSGLKLKKAVKEFGRSNFEVELLEECDTPEELDLREDYWISELNAAKSPEYYNSYASVHPNFRGHHHKESSVKSIKFKCSQSLKGRKFTEGTKLKMREAKQGITWVNNGEIVMMIKKGDLVPEGFTPGRLDRKSGEDHWNYNKVWIYNVNTLESKMVTPDYELPEGWSYGNASARGRVYVTDGNVVRRIKKSDPIPEGFRLGKK